jgi:hypothetical protein
MRRSLQRIAGNCFMAVVTVAVTLTCSEASLRRVAPELTAPAKNPAFLSAFYEANTDGVFTWPPGREVRYVRMHRNRVEYDVAFQVNDLGLVDDIDYANAPRVARQVALVGDSFTAGYHGGNPWVPALRKEMASEVVRLYNLGIGGAGFLQFEALLRSVSRHVDFTDVVLVAISDDLQRGQWRMDVDGDVARFCLRTWPHWLCRMRRPYFHRIDLESDPVKWIESNREAIRGPDRMALGALLVEVARASERTEAEREKRVAENAGAIESIVESFGADRVSLVHLPVRGEVERGVYDTEARGLARLMSGLGAGYFPALTRCDWNSGMFFRHDEHPNAAGYDRVAECVAAHLQQRLIP